MHQLRQICWLVFTEVHLCTVVQYVHEFKYKVCFVCVCVLFILVKKGRGSFWCPERKFGIFSGHMVCQQFLLTCSSFNPSCGLAIPQLYFLSNIFALCQLNNSVHHMYRWTAVVLYRTVHLFTVLTGLDWYYHITTTYVILLCMRFVGKLWICLGLLVWKKCKKTESPSATYGIFVQTGTACTMLGSIVNK